MRSKSSLRDIARNDNNQLSLPLLSNQTSKRNTRQTTQQRHALMIDEASSESNLSLSTTIDASQNMPKIKIEMAEDNSNTRNRFEFTNVNDLIVTEILLDSFMRDLCQWQKDIDDFKEKNVEFKREAKCKDVYEQVRHLMLDYIKCDNNRGDKEALKEKLVNKVIYFYLDFGI